MAYVIANMHFGYFILLCHFGLVLMGAPLPKFNAQKCDALALDECFKDLQVFLRLTSLPFTSDSAQLDKLCQQSIAGYNCSMVLHENRDCLSVQNKELLPVFISMAEYTHFMLCGNSKSNGYLRPAFLESSECILKHKEQISCCGRESHVTDLPVLRILEESAKSLPERQISTCCPLSHFIQCATNSIMECGENAVNFTTEYIVRAAGEQVHGVCQGLNNYPDLDASTCPESVPTCSGGFMHHVNNNMLIFIFSLLAIGKLKCFDVHF